MEKLRFLEGAGAQDMGAFDIADVRAASRALFRDFNGPDAGGCSVTAVELPGPDGPVPARWYRPATARCEILPLVVFLHGGGWALGDLDVYETLVKALCVASGACFLAVDYRLAPEHKFPAGLEDALAAIRWSAAEAGSLGIDPARIGIMGDSAGGNLAAALALLLRDDPHVRLAAQFLIYPVLDVASSHETFPSRMQHGNRGYVLSLRDIDVTTEWYLDDPALVSDARVSPLLATDFSGLPPAVILAAGFDPLRDEAVRYADRLRAAGVPVEFKCFEGAVHAFVSFGDLAVAQQARAFLAAEAQRLLGAR